jgi:hypothetical protein
MRTSDILPGHFRRKSNFLAATLAIAFDFVAHNFAFMQSVAKSISQTASPLIFALSGSVFMAAETVTPNAPATSAIFRPHGTTGN